MAEPLLNDEIRNQVRELFAEIDQPVEVLFFGTDDPANCEYCDMTKQLLGEVISLSDKLSLSVYDLEKDAEIAQQYHVEDVPTFVMVGNKDGKLIDYGVRFKGVPAGHEFSTLVNDLVIVSKRDSGLRPETREFLRTLQKPVHLQVFVTPT